MSDHSPLQPLTVRQDNVPEMVERVARALAVAAGCNPDDPAFVRYPSGEAFGVCWRDKFEKSARAAIEAMPQWQLLGYFQFNGGGGIWEEVVASAAGEDGVVTAFIDAALSGKGSGGADAIADCETNQSPTTPSVGSVGR